MFDTGDEFLTELTSFAKNNDLSAASFTAISSFSDVMLDYFDVEEKDFEKIPVEEQVDVLSLTGNIIPKDDELPLLREPRLHAHVVVGRFDDTARGGHLREAHVRPRWRLSSSSCWGTCAAERRKRQNFH